MSVETRSYNFGFGLVEATITNSGAAVDAWIRGVPKTSKRPCQDVIVGLDCECEWRPKTDPKVNNKVATLQLCVGSRCIIIQLLHVDSIPASLLRFLVLPTVVCVGVDVNKHVDKLRSEYRIKVARTEDLREMARHRMPVRFACQPELMSLAQRIMGLSIVRPQSLTFSNWERSWLNDDQMQYACLEAYASCMIGMRLRSLS